MWIDGACLCGRVSYEAEIEPEKVAICHCHDCQVNSGTAFGVVVAVVDGRFKLLTGQLREFEKTAASGRKRILSFCGDCGTRIHARTDDDPAAFFGLRVGSIRQRARLVPKVQVWCDSALPWVSDLAEITARATQN